MVRSQRPSRLLSRRERLGGFALISFIVIGALSLPRIARSKVHTTQVMPPIESNQVVERIPDGMRAITVRVDTESAVEGWARSGNFVDVILIRPDKERSSGFQSIVVAEYVKILSAGSSTQTVGSRDSAPRAPNTVTLLVSQEDALKITTATGLGKLTFALRGNNDDGPTLAREVDHRRILGTPPQNEELLGRFNGRARGPDGKVYLLKKNAEWIEAGPQTAGGLGQVGDLAQEFQSDKSERR